MAQLSHCHHKRAATPSCSEDSENKNCCNNETVILKLDQDQQINSFEIILNGPMKWFVSAFSYVFMADLMMPAKTTKDPFKLKPPLIPRDICVLFQRFIL